MIDGRASGRLAAGVAALAFLSAGCITIKEHLTVRADGSGTLVVDVRSDIAPEIASGMRQQGRGAAACCSYPPLTKADASALFPGERFVVNVEEGEAGAGTAARVKVSFKDINALLASPYGRAHSLSMRVEGGMLHFAAVSGMRAILAFSEMKGRGMMAPGLAELSKKKREMYVEFKLTLPARIATTSGTKEGSTASWVVDRSKIEEDAKAAEIIGRQMNASCSAVGIGFTPVSPPRLGLLPFEELKAGATGEKGKVHDEKKVAAAARFVPYALRVTRHFDLTGEGYGGENASTLVGAVVIPREYSPQKWGDVKIEELTDDRGNDLRLGEKGGARRPYSPRGMYGMFGEEEEEGAGRDERHTVSLNFKVPERGVREIARIRGSIQMQYFGSSHIIKLHEAVSKGSIVDPRKGPMRGFSGGGEKKLSNPKLDELGLEITHIYAMHTYGMTNLTISSKETDWTISEVQVFDAQGKPWQSLSMSQGMHDTTMHQIIVPGSPEAPLSVALLVKGGGASVKVPIALEHVPLSGYAEER